MELPEFVRGCMDAVENAGYPCYAVGGCVRDSLLGLIPHDYDLCSAAAPEVIRQIFAGRELVLAGEKHGTVGVVTPGGVVEITTFRTEGGYHDSRRPDWVRFETSVEADLARRDFTVNAIAFSPTRGLRDPFGGREDLKNGILRTVGDAPTRFAEDALRILRGVRFAVCYALEPEPDTLRAMNDGAQRIWELSGERVFAELCKILPRIRADALIRFQEIFVCAVPELRPAIGFNQHNPHHIFDVYVHTAKVVEAVPAVLPLRWAALLHDVGKIPTFTTDADGCGHFYGHAEESARMAGDILHRLKAPNTLRERVEFLVARHMQILPPDRRLLRRYLGKFGLEPLLQLLALQKADRIGTGVAQEAPDTETVAAILRELAAADDCLRVTDLAINGKDLLAMGLKGRQIGKCLETLLLRVQAEILPNTRAALLEEAHGFAEREKQDVPEKTLPTERRKL